MPLAADGYRIGIDTGGTFTDVVALAETSRAVVTTKTLTTPADPSIGFMQGVQKIARVAGFELDAVSAISHETTVATNALLQTPRPPDRRTRTPFSFGLDLILNGLERLRGVSPERPVRDCLPVQRDASPSRTAFRWHEEGYTRTRERR